MRFQCVSDSRWDDWRPHLAMIISNTSANPEIIRRSISTLGDTLAARSDIFAAHFCYILSQCDFGSYGTNNVKIVLIGANHHKPYDEFVSTEAITLTEIYEYARKLSEPLFCLTELQSFKFDMAVKMVDYGLIEKALLYIEQVATNIVAEPGKYKQNFIKNVYVLGDRLKYYDPVCKDSEEDAAANLPWLMNLAEIVGMCEKGEIVRENNQNLETLENVQEQNWNEQALESNQPSMMSLPEADWRAKLNDGYNTNNVQYHEDNVNDTQQQYPSYQQDYWQQQQQQQQNYGEQQQDYSSMNYGQNVWQPYGAEQQEEQTNAQSNQNYEVSWDT